jgi:hypothetical protein
LQPEARQLCDELLGLTEREMVALGAGNLDELEHCLSRKSHVLEELTNIGSGAEQPDLLAGELLQILEQVRKAHNRVRDGVREMLDTCENEIVGLRRGRKAHRAYHRGRTGGTYRPGRKPGKGRDVTGVTRRVS